MRSVFLKQADPGKVSLFQSRQRNWLNRSLREKGKVGTPRPNKGKGMGKKEKKKNKKEEEETVQGTVVALMMELGVKYEADLLNALLGEKGFDCYIPR